MKYHRTTPQNARQHAGNLILIYHFCVSVLLPYAGTMSKYESTPQTTSSLAEMSITLEWIALKWPRCCSTTDNPRSRCHRGRTRAVSSSLCDGKAAGCDTMPPNFLSMLNSRLHQQSKFHLVWSTGRVQAYWKGVMTSPYRGKGPKYNCSG